MKNKAGEKRPSCPYCDEEVTVSQSSGPCCMPCGITFRVCSACKVTVLDKQAEKCPKCGGKLD